MTDCLETEALVALLEGTLASERAEAIIEHVDRCRECAEVIANLGVLDGPRRRIDRYQIERVLGTGAMGIVYAAFDPELQRRVAIKLVRPDITTSVQPRMLDEARALARMNHPNVVGVYDVGEHDGEIYLATELVDGVTLGEWQHGRSRDEIIDAWLQVARGLAAAHAEGIVHRDVKPANAFVGRDGRVRVGDFGIAHLGAPTEAATPLIDEPVVAGTPAYMAPEQESGRVDARSDQFAICVAITEGLTGARASANDEIVVEPAALATALTRGLRFDPDERFPTMQGLADAIAAALQPAPVRARTSWVAAVALSLAIAAVAIVVVAAYSTGGRAASCATGTVPARVWSPARGAALAARLPAAASPTIEHWLRTWSIAGADVCATANDAALRAQREQCLAASLAQLDALLTRWEASPPRSADAMHTALDELPHVAWCSSAAVSATSFPLSLVRTAAREVATRHAETDPAAAVRTLRATLAGTPDDFPKVAATVALIQLLGVDQLAEVESLASTARASIAVLGGDVALEAELDLYLGHVLGSAKRGQDAISALERALTAARIAYSEGSPQEANVLTALTGAYYQRDGVASAAARKMGTRANELWAKNGIEMPSVIMPASAGELVEHLKTLRAAALESDGPNTVTAFDAEYALINAHIIAEQPAEALAAAQRALVLHERLNLHSPYLSNVDYNVAVLLIAKGRAAEAIPFARAAITAAKQFANADDLASARGALGEALLDLGRVTEAREPLRENLQFSNAENKPARLRAKARFLLAQATWSIDPVRAVAAARVARSEIDSAFETPDVDTAANPVTAPLLRHRGERLIAQIDAWLAAHHASP